MRKGLCEKQSNAMDNTSYSHPTNQKLKRHFIQSGALIKYFNINCLDGDGRNRPD
jgi:hypothetical protein